MPTLTFLNCISHSRWWVFNQRGRGARNWSFWSKNLPEIEEPSLAAIHETFNQQYSLAKVWPESPAASNTRMDISQCPFSYSLETSPNLHNFATLFPMISMSNLTVLSVFLERWDISYDAGALIPQMFQLTLFSNIHLVPSAPCQETFTQL